MQRAPLPTPGRAITGVASAMQDSQASAVVMDAGVPMQPATPSAGGAAPTVDAGTTRPPSASSAPSCASPRPLDGDGSRVHFHRVHMNSVDPHAEAAFFEKLSTKMGPRRVPCSRRRRPSSCLLVWRAYRRRDHKSASCLSTERYKTLVNSGVVAVLRRTCSLSWLALKSATLASCVASWRRKLSWSRS